MKRSLFVNQEQAIELGLTNINQAHIFDFLISVSTWAEEVVKGNIVYYFVARQKISSELPLLNLKADTVYRHLKSLEKIGLILYKKIDGKDCIKITKKGKQYLLKEDGKQLGFKSEKDANSDLNPTKLGNKSENDSDLNPTYNTTKDNKKEKKEKSSYQDFIKKLKNSAPIKSKVTATKEGAKLFKDIAAISDEVIAKYIAHQKEKGTYAVRITAFVLDWDFYKTNQNQKQETFMEKKIRLAKEKQEQQQEQINCEDTELC